MATPMTHLVSFFLLFSFFYCTLSLLDPEDEIGILVEPDDVNMVQSNKDSRKRCDFSVGKWVYDESYPLYDPNCPYLSTAVTCQKNGRPDSDYEKWKWKPSGCSIPRFVHIASTLLYFLVYIHTHFIYQILLYLVYMVHHGYALRIQISIHGNPASV